MSKQQNKYLMFTPEVISTIENALDNKSDFFADRYPDDDPNFIDGMARVRAARKAIHEFSETDIRTVYVVLRETRVIGVTVPEISRVFLDKLAAEKWVDKMTFEDAQGDPREAATYSVEDHELHLPWAYSYP